MNILTLDWPQSAGSLLSQARSASAGDGEFLRLIMAGTCHVDSWLIENRVLPALREKGLHMLGFSLRIANRQERSAKLLPLPDGSAFACAADELWSALEARDALHEISYVGYRYASGNHWPDEFQATLQFADGLARLLTPSEVAGIWRDATGVQPAGYASGAVDHLQAWGSELLDKAFRAQGRLGLQFLVHDSWGFCYFNNMAIALEKLRNEGKIRKALVLDIDLHFSDGTVDILDSKGYSGGGRLRRPAGLLGGILIHPGVVANDRAVCRSVRHDRWR